MQVQSKIVQLYATRLLTAIFITYCQEKQTWTTDEINIWETSCNTTFTKDGIEPEALKKFCNCSVFAIQYD